MLKTIFVLFCISLTGCANNYYRNKDLEYRIKILEKRMTLLELDLDEVLDVCP